MEDDIICRFFAPFNPYSNNSWYVVSIVEWIPSEIIEEPLVIAPAIN